jgi:hypothetical protein
MPSGRSVPSWQRSARPGRWSIEDAAKVFRYDTVRLAWRASRSSIDSSFGHSRPGVESNARHTRAVRQSKGGKVRDDAPTDDGVALFDQRRGHGAAGGRPGFAYAAVFAAAAAFSALATIATRRPWSRATLRSSAVGGSAFDETPDARCGVPRLPETRIGEFHVHTGTLPGRTGQALAGHALTRLLLLQREKHGIRWLLSRAPAGCVLARSAAPRRSTLTGFSFAHRPPAQEHRSRSV